MGCPSWGCSMSWSSRRCTATKRHLRDCPRRGKSGSAAGGRRTSTLSRCRRGHQSSRRSSCSGCSRSRGCLRSIPSAGLRRLCRCCWCSLIEAGMCPTVIERGRVSCGANHEVIVTTYNSHRAVERRTDVVIHARHEVIVCLARFTWTGQHITMFFH
jgi:hypothetical protein